MFARVFVSPIYPQSFFRRSTNFKPKSCSELFFSPGGTKSSVCYENFDRKKCAQISVSSEQSPQNICRDSADYKPSIWGDMFMCANNLGSTDEEPHEYKEKVRLMILADIDFLEKLCLIDAIQRLGVSYHFEKEIDDELQKILHLTEDYETDLYTVALIFRLLRQQGHYISCDVFGKFKDSSDGKFKESLLSDARGMLSLYEATHLRVHGEDVLDEALAFTTTHLQSLASSASDHSLADQIRHALYQPLHKGLARLEARRYMPVYQLDASHNELLLTFAKLDFNKLQKVHQKELSDISEWWEDLNFAKKLPFARNRIVEMYFCMLGLYYEPQYGLARRMVTKVIAMTSIIDDIYDVYGTMEELVLFTDAVERWDIATLDQVPQYMQICFVGLLEVYKEMEENMALQGQLYGVAYAKQAMINIVKAYFHEAKWFHKNYTPTLEEYLSVALVTSSGPIMITTSFVGMGDIVTKDSFKWLLNQPKMLTSVSVISRLVDDIVTHKFEQKRGHVASAIECYMKENSTAKEEDAINEFKKQVSDAWKDMNRECLHPIEVPMPLLTRVLNMARLVEVVYKDDVDGYSTAGIKEMVASLLVDSVPI